MLKIGDLTFVSDKEFEFNVSKYSTNALLIAEHVDELKTDGKTHLRIDYKVTGMGSAACGPGLADEYKLNDKEVDFSFSIVLN